MQIDLKLLLEFMWRCRAWIFSAALLGAVGGLAAALFMPHTFRAEVVLIVSQRATPVQGLGQLGSLASLAGVSLSDVDTVEPLAIARSRDFSGRFLVSEGIESKMMPGALGDPAGMIRRLLLGNGRIDPRESLAYFMNHVVSVEEDKRAGLVRVSIRWTDPIVAASWANDFVAQINSYTRKKAIARSERSVAYLQREIRSQPLVAVQQSMGRVLEGELQKLQLAQGEDQYSFRVIDPAIAPLMRSSPILFLWVIVGSFLLSTLSLVTCWLVKGPAFVRP